MFTITLSWWHQAEWCSGHAGGKECHPDRPWQAWDMSLCEQHVDKQEQVKSPAPQRGQSQTWIKAGQLLDRE